MRVVTLISAFIMLALLLYLLMDGVSAGQVAHHGQTVEDSGDPSDCIVCHDGVIAPEAHYCTTDCSAATAHSILKEYPPRFKERSYAPLGSVLKKGIRLFNGKVSCISCHDLRSSMQYHLIMDNSGSALCFSCHLT